MRPNSLCTALDLAHRIDLEEGQWVQELLDAVAQGVGSGTRVLLWFGHGGDAMETSQTRASDPSWTEILMEMAHRWQPATNRYLLSRGPCFSLVQAVRDSQGAIEPEQQAMASELQRRLGLDDYWVLRGLGVDGRGLLMGVGFERGASVDRRALLEPWLCVAAHVGAAWRLRRALAQGGGQVEAVLSPDGRRVEHAEGAALDTELRQALRLSARSLEQARSSRRDPVERLLGQRVLVAGRWSLVDRFDSDGRRYTLARVNDPGSLASLLPALSRRERQVSMLLASGSSLKFIGYELGLSVSTVNGAARRAMRKLGVRSRVGLVRAVHEAVDALLRPAGP